MQVKFLVTQLKKR